MVNAESINTRILPQITQGTIHFRHDPGSLLCRFPGHGEDGSIEKQ